MSHMKSTAWTGGISPRDLVRRGWLFAIVLFAWSAAAAAPAFARSGPDSFADLVEKLSPAVVNISTVQTVTAQQRNPFPPGSPFEEFFDEFFGRRGQDGQPIRRRLQSLGSGFIIDPSGLIVTNNHVVKDADQITVRTEDGEEYEAKVVGRDPDVDVALLRIEADKPLPSLKWGDSDAARIGDWVLTIGNPFGLSGSVSAGIISAHHRDISGGPYDDFIQTDAAINRGNSGGPMFNVAGEVIGINTAIFSPTGGSVGIGFAIPSNQARHVIEQIEKYGYARRGFLGVSIQGIDKMTAEALGLEDAKGALVASVTPDSPADKAGIQPYDIVIEFDGKEVKTSGDLVRMVGDLGVGQKAEVVLLRNGKRKTVTVVTAERPRSDEQKEDEAGPAEDESLGVTFTDITPILRQQFDLPEDVEGALVLQVPPELRRRLARGDVVTEVNRMPVKNADDVTRAIADLKKEGKKAALFRIYRNGDQLFIPIPLEDEDGE